jgi:hypothetical protein
MNILTHSKTVKSDRVIWVLAMVLGAVHAYISRWTMNADGVSYLDIGELYFRLPLRLAVSGYFSPLYSWLIGAFLAVFRPSAQWESPVVHFVNYLLYLCALWSLKSFADELLRLKKEQGVAAAPVGKEYGHERVWMIFFCALFVWAALRMVTMATVAPDMLYAAIIFLLFSQLLRIQRNRGGGWLQAAGLGLILGIAYLARAAALPIIVLAVMSLFILYRNVRRSIPHVLLTVAVICLVTGPYIALLSLANGRISIGGTGTMIYAWHINQKPWQNWQGPGAVHPTRLIYGPPNVYEFGRPVPGTYPPWYDPSFWDEGMAPEYRLIPLISNFVRNSKHLVDYFLESGGLLVGLISLHLAARKGFYALLKGLWPVWCVALPSVVALLVYTSLHVEPRYIMPFWVTLWIVIFFALPFSFHDPAPPFSIPIVTAMIVFLTAGVLYSTLILPRELSYGINNNRIAAGLVELPVHPGEEIATIGVSNNIYWARLARLRVIAEIPADEAADFWAAPPAVRSAIYERLDENKVVAIVARGIPSQAAVKPWRKLADNFYACRLSELRGGR